MRKEGGYLPGQRAFPGVSVTWLGPPPSRGDRDKPVSTGQCLWKREETFTELETTVLGPVEEVRGREQDG